MQKPTLLLLFLVLLAAIAGAFYLPQLTGEPDAPVMTWTESDEVDGSEETTEQPSTEGGTYVRTEVASAQGAPVGDNEERIAAILRGRVVNKSRQPVAGAKVWLEIRQASQDDGDWDTAWEFFSMRDPIVNVEFAGGPKELEAIAAYKRGKRELKKKLKLGGDDSGSSSDSDAAAATGGSAAPKEGEKGKKKKKRRSKKKKA